MKNKKPSAGGIGPMETPSSVLQHVAYAFPTCAAEKVIALMEGITAAMCPQIKRNAEMLTACRGDLDLFYRALWLVLETLQRSLPVRPADKKDRWVLERLAGVLVESAMKGETKVRL